MLPKSFPYKRIVLIADTISTINAEKIHEYDDLEKTDTSTILYLKETLESLGLDVQIYSHPKQLGDNAAKHINDLVFSIYGGSGSRNRMALIPAVAETYGISFIGPDTYGRIMCQDKVVSKDLAQQAGFCVPSHRILRFESELPLVKLPAPKVVIKPLLEGSSIGISQHSLTDNLEIANSLIKTLILRFNQPVLVEEFIPGREVSLNFIQSQSGYEWTFSEIQVKGKPQYFDNNVFDAEEKLFRNLDRKVVTINEYLEPSIIQNAENLVSFIGKTGYGRIDGKLYNNIFFFLELTPDAWISPKGAFAGSFTNLGKTYREVIANILKAMT